jgi:hypothetical protein
MRDRNDVPSTTAVADPSSPAEVPAEGEQTAPPAEGSQEQAAVEAKVVDTTAELETLREQLSTAEKKRIPDLQRAIAKAETERNKAVDDARNFRSSMLEWTRRELLAAGAEDRWREIESREQERTGQVLQTEAQRAETMEVINDLLDSDETTDRAFGRYLRATVKAGQQSGTPIRVTADNVGTFREMFDAARGAASTTQPAAAAATPPATPARTVATAPTPVRTVTPAAPPQGNPEPSAYEQTKGSPRGMFGLAFRKREGTQE